jgi:hypothetical protein
MFLAKTMVWRTKMKKNLGLLFLVTVCLAGCLVYVPRGDYGSSGATPPPQEQQDDRWNYNTQDTSDFYGYLSPYGFWVSYSPYGYVWIPRDVDYGWRPYTRGHWIWTDYGWTWVSVERWGWLVHHYGRWGWNRRLGWFWVPGTIWGPSWVAWRSGGMYIGWAPLPPGDDFAPGFGFRRRNFDIPGHYWNFVRGIEFMDPRLDPWIIPPERNITIINYTQIDVNIHVRENRVINEGVAIDQVRRLTNKPIERHQLRDAQRPGADRVEARDVVLYRPELRRNETSRPKEVLNEDQAASRLETPQPSGRVVRRTPQSEEASVRQLHQQEERRLEQDQRAEVEDIRRKTDSERTALRNPEEKRKADAAAKAKIAEVQKKHEAEKAQLSQRHKEEEDQVKKSQLKRKEAEKH